jgi:hypothetical protein
MIIILRLLNWTDVDTVIFIIVIVIIIIISARRSRCHILNGHK